MGIRLSNWTHAVLFVWFCLAPPLLPLKSLTTGVRVAKGLADNSTNNTDSPTPATNLRCHSYNFQTVSCEWTRGGQGDSVASTDVLWAEEFPSYGKPPRPCDYYACRQKCNTTHCSESYPQCIRCDYYVQTTNNLGQMVNSSRVLFNLIKDSTLNPPFNVRVTNRSSSELDVRWYPPDPGPDRISYTVQYRWEGSPANDPWRTKKEIDSNITTLTNLEHPYGLYFVRVKSTLEHLSEESVFSEIAQGHTTETAPTDVPEDFHCADAPNPNNDTRHVHLSWKLLENEYKRNGEILGYVITYSSSEASVPTRLDAGANASNYTVYDLKKDHNYSFNLRAFNSMGPSTKEASCSKLIPVPVELAPVGLAVGVCVGIAILIIVLIMAWCCVKSSIRKFPAIRLPSKLQADNEYLSEHRHRGTVREVEVFDDLKPCRLFVHLGPKETNVIDIFDDMPVITDGFDIGDKPRGAVGFQNDIIDLDSLPLLGLKGDLMLEGIPEASDPLLPGPRREEDPSSGDEYGGALPSSPVSVGSGGSYLGIREEDEDMVYSCMTKDGLSPVEKENTEGQRVLGERPQDSAARPNVDGLPLLHFRRESADSDEDNLQDGDAVHAYSRMSASPSRRENAPAAAGPVRKDPQADRPSTHGATHSKRAKHPKGAKHPKSKRGGDQAGATCAGEGGISDYVQQGFVPGAAAHGDGDYNPGDPADSYSQLGLLGGPSPASSLHGINPDHRNQDAGFPVGNRGGVNETLGDPNRRRDGRTEDSSNPVRVRASSAPSGVAVPPSQPGTESRPSTEQPWNPNIAQAQSVDSLSDDDEDEGLTYVTVALESDSDESAGRTEPADMNGYVTQAMMPPNFEAPSARAVSSDTVANAAPSSGYVDQAQLSHLSPPPSARSPVHTNPVHMNGAVASGSGYVTAAEARGVISPGPDEGPVGENSTNNNNNNPRNENVAQGSVPPMCDSGPDNNDRESTPPHRAPGTLPVNEATRHINGVIPRAQPAGPGYVTTAQLASLPLPSPRMNGHVNGPSADPS